MSYVIQIWEQPADVALPSHPKAVWEMLERLYVRAPGPNPKYAELARQLTALFPEKSHPDGEAEAWLDGHADGGGAQLVWSLGLCSSDRLDEVHAAVLAGAHRLGLHVADEQAGRLYLAHAASPAPAVPPEEPGRTPERAPERRPALVDETPTEPVPFDPPMHSGHHGAPSAEARSVMARAERRDADARYELGRLFKLGQGVERSDELAVHWWTLAAELGQRDAPYHLGMACILGEGVEKNERQAFKWFCQAADQAHPDALYSLGQMYGEGLATPKDTVVASALCYCAHRLGCRHAKPVFQPGETAHAMALAALIARSGGKVQDTLAAWRRAQERAARVPPRPVEADARQAAQSGPVSAEPQRFDSLLRLFRRGRGQVA